VHHKEACGGVELSPRILNLGIRYRWKFSFTTRSFEPRVRSLRIHWPAGWDPELV